jgi:hypothetical protein
MVSPNQVSFGFYNTGPAASSITDIYFDDGSLLGIASIIPGSVGVDFSQYASPPELPAAQDCVPPFETTAGFLADSNPPAQPNGVNPGEWVKIVFFLQGSQVFADVINELSTGALRIGIHVQGFASGGSETFINDGFTAIKLISFGAAAARSAVTLQWVTGTETANAGFNLLRSSSLNGPKVKVNKYLIAASAYGASGAGYSYVDAPGYGTFYYWLQDVDSSGTATLHGPVKAVVASPFKQPAIRPSLPAIQ